jgi:hypothetical protein
MSSEATTRLVHGDGFQRATWAVEWSV